MGDNEKTHRTRSTTTADPCRTEQSSAVQQRPSSARLSQIRHRAGRRPPVHLRRHPRTTTTATLWPDETVILPPLQGFQREPEHAILIIIGTAMLAAKADRCI